MLRIYAFIFSAVLLSNPLLAEKNWSFFASGGSLQYTYDLPVNYIDETTLGILSAIPASSSTSQAIDNFRSALAVTQSQPLRIRMQETHFNFGFKYLPDEGDHLGFSIGLLGAQGSAYCASNCGELLLFSGINLIQAASQDTSNATGGLLPSFNLTPLLLPVVLFPSDLKPEVTYGMLDFQLNWHFRPQKFFDPYIGGGLGLGYGEASISSFSGSGLAWRIAGSVGLQLNFADWLYVYIAGEYYHLNLEFKLDPSGMNYTVSEGAPRFMTGVGIRF